MDDRTLLATIADLVGSDRIEDDCALLPLDGTTLVATTDMLHEQTDFPAGMSDWQMGWMAVAATLSDIAAMGASPGLLLIAVGLDRPERLRPVMEGASACCSTFDTPLAGGDIDEHQELTLVTSAIGFAKCPVHRRGACVGDQICVTGILGRALAALQGFHQYDLHLFEPRPRISEGQEIARAGATSLMDISDGLALSLHDLAAVNDVGYAIETHRLPRPEDLPAELALEFALFGGGDYELLFTIPPEQLPLLSIEFSRIGEVIPLHGAFADGMPLPARGYQHQWDTTFEKNW